MGTASIGPPNWLEHPAAIESQNIATQTCMRGESEADAAGVRFQAQRPQILRIMADHRIGRLKTHIEER